MAIGMSISITIIVILNSMVEIFWYFRNDISTATHIHVGLLVWAFGYPWITLWGDSQLDWVGCTLINGAIFGIAMGFIFKEASR